MNQLTTQPEMSPRYRIGGMIFLTVVIVLLILGGWKVDAWLEDAQRAPIDKVLVSGVRNNVQDAVIERTIRANHPESFFELDVASVHREIEAMPWVYRASIRKRWPNGLYIHVVEEIASARWNNDVLLNQYGETFDAQSLDTGLPNLYGPGGTELTALDGYRSMQSLLNTANLTIDALYLSERFAWNITLTNGVRLNLGRAEYVDRLQRFVDVYPYLENEQRQVEYVDLRYDTGLAVGWKQATTPEQES